uniref:Sphingomyelin phosphodiesterase acid like 3A n=1 Tax=Lates calcarifer TaxID=8187 RepID=A0A4W6F737_LATCA
MAQLPCFALLLLCSAAPLAAAPTRRSYLPGTGRFWHITDLHLDPTYHLAPDPTKVCFSSKGAPATHAGLYGDFLCDSPYRLIQSAFTHMAPLTQQQDFIIWTGDSPPHVPAGELSTDIVIQVISNMTQTIRQHFPNLTVYPALGNHDYWPQDQMPTSTNAIYKAAAQLWKPWLQAEALLTLSQGGFYSQLVKPGLRLISLNTILYYGPNKVTENMTDPAGQFEWLEKTLEKAAQSLEKVYIIAHVPVGYLPFARNTTAIRESHNERLVAIFREYSDVIAGHFYGHTHRDSIMVLLDQQGKPVNSLFVSPAVTPIKHVLEPYSNNPAFRMYLYNTKDYALLIHVCGHTEGHLAVTGIYDRRPGAAGQRVHPHHRLEQLHLQAGVQTDSQHAAARHRGAAGQFSCQVWRDPLCEPAVVHPRSLHRHSTLPQRQDQEEGEARRSSVKAIIAVLI